MATVRNRFESILDFQFSSKPIPDFQDQFRIGSEPILNRLEPVLKNYLNNRKYLLLLEEISDKTTIKCDENNKIKSV